MKVDTPIQKECKPLSQEAQKLHRVADQLNWVST